MEKRSREKKSSEHTNRRQEYPKGWKHTLKRFSSKNLADNSVLGYNTETGETWAIGSVNKAAKTEVAIREVNEKRTFELFFMLSSFLGLSVFCFASPPRAKPSLADIPKDLCILCRGAKVSI